MSLFKWRVVMVSGFGYLLVTGDNRGKQEKISRISKKQSLTACSLCGQADKSL